MNRPIQVKQTDSENRGGKLKSCSFYESLILRFASFIKLREENVLLQL